MNENEEDLVFQRPRSHSLPNLTFVDIEEYGSEDGKTNNNYTFK